MGCNVQIRVLIQLCCVVACFGFLASEAKYVTRLEPMDLELCITHNVTFTCTLEITPINGSSLGFGINAGTNEEFVPVDEKRVDVINQTMAKLTLYNITIRTLVKCFYWETLGDVREKTQMLEKISTIALKPLPVTLEEISYVNCIVDNYVDGMNCSWDTGRPYSDSSTPKVMFQWIIGDKNPPSHDDWNNCPHLSEKYRFCSWSSSRDGDFTMKTIRIKLTQINECGGENVFSTFNVDTTKIVKPKPVTRLTSVAVNSTCINVKWRASNPEYVKEHIVKITNKWDEPRLYAFNTTFESGGHVHRRTFCNLHPNTKYKFSVTLQPIGHQAGFLSDSRQTEALTYSDIPGASPEVVSGGFSWNPQDCKTPNAVRRICIPLKPIKSVDQNGEMKGLVVTYVNEQKLEYQDDHLAEDFNYVCKSLMLCNTSYKVYIKARNGNGTSIVNSSITISAFAPGIKQPQFIVEAGDSTNVTLSWPKTVRANTFMVFWCRNRNGQCQEKKDFNWAEFPGNITEAVIQIDKTNSPQDFLYGVSVLTDQGSSGFSWHECVYLKNGYPLREVKNLAVSPGPVDDSLVVTWDKLTCQSDQPYIDKYNIRYNKVNDRHYTSVNVSAMGEAREVLNYLERDQTYNVTVRAVTKSGQYGPVGKSKIGTPVNKSLRQWQSALIVLGAIVGVALVVVIVLFCMKKYRETKRSFQDTKNITIPKDESKAGRQNSNDSGYGPLTPPPDRYVEQPTYNDLLKPNMQFQSAPGGYITANVDNTQTPIENCTARVVCNLPSIDSSDSFITSEQIKADVGFVFNESDGATSEKKVSTVSMDNGTAVKTRVKNDSGDSGMSESLAKEMSDISENDLKNRVLENVGEKNVNIISSVEVSNYVSVENALHPSTIIPGNTTHQNRSSPSALNGLENRGFVTAYLDSVFAAGYVSSATACQDLHPTNIIGHSVSFDDYVSRSTAETGSFRNSSNSLPVSSNENVSLPNAVHGPPSSVATSRIPRCSPDTSFTQFQNPSFHPSSDENISVKGYDNPIICNGNVSFPYGIQNLEPSLVTNNNILSKTNAIPAALTQDISGYVLTTDIPTTTSNMPLKSYSTVGQSSKESPQTNNPLDSIENFTNIKRGCQVHNTNGYVDFKFISNGNLKEPSLLSNNKSHPSNDIRMAAREDTENEHIRNNNSDLMSYSLEDESSEIDNLLQQDCSDGYVSSEFAMERL